MVTKSHLPRGTVESTTLTAGGASHGAERRRLVIAALAGLVGASVAKVLGGWQLSVLAGWDLTAVVLLTWIWVSIGGLDSKQTRARAALEDDSRAMTFALVLGAAVASLPGVALALVRAKDETAALSATLTVAGVVTVMLSWLLVHTIYVLRYAHLYYRHPHGGVDFPSEPDPDFLDFAYLSFTVGMTFQVSDTDIEARAIRRLILRHALISYLFGAVIVATTINVIAGLVK